MAPMKETTEDGAEPRRRRSLLYRFGRAVLIGNIALVTIAAAGAWGTHRWAASSPERFDSLVSFAQRYVLVPASLIEDHGFRPEAVEAPARLIERMIVGAAESAPRHDSHLYLQGRVLMAMPAVYKRLGREAERIERAERATRIFSDLVARNPEVIDYRRRLAVSLNVHADDLADMGRHEASLALRDRLLTVTAELLRREPGHWRWRWYEAWAETGIAESMVAVGRRDAAGPHIEVARTTAESLCRERPGDSMVCGLRDRIKAVEPGISPTP
jgi:hypothetical protein